MTDGRADILVSPGLPAALKTELAALGVVRECRLARSPNISGSPKVLALEAMEPLPAEVIHALPQSVGLIANLGVGIDNIDLSVARAAGMVVTNTPVVTEDTADLAMTLLLSAFRRTTNYERLLRSDQWRESERPVHFGRSLKDKTLGIVGFGRIGQALAFRARAFGMYILYYGPREKPEAAERVQAAFRSNLADLLVESDAVSLNCSLNADTKHLIDAKRLREMKLGAVLINTGRGALVDESALIDALDSGVLAAAGLDVFENEPHVPQALRSLDNVTLLPHVGSCTVECRRAMQSRLIGNVRAFLESAQAIDVV